MLPKALTVKVLPRCTQVMPSLDSKWVMASPVLTRRTQKGSACVLREVTLELVVPLTAYSTVTGLLCAALRVTGMFTLVALSLPAEPGAWKPTVAAGVSLSVRYITVPGLRE